MELTDVQKELKAIEPKIDFLHEVLGCGLYAEVTVTSDGYWLGRQKGDIGFNEFLGRPSEVAMERTIRFLKQMTPEARAIAERILAGFGIEFEAAKDKIAVSVASFGPMGINWTIGRLND